MADESRNATLPANESARLGYLPTLDGWRAIAIGLVLFAHGSYSLSAFTGGVSDTVLSLFPNIGLIGVRIFFAISGFLICSRLLDEWTLTGTISLRKFYVRRLFRIMPPLLVMLLFTVVLTALGVIWVPTQQWVAGLLFAANYVRSGGTWYLGHLWSLAVEEHFYLVFPGMLLLTGIRRGLLACGVIAIGVAFWRAAALKVLSISAAFDPAYFWGRTDIQADGLLWGCVAAFVYTSPTGRTWLRFLLRPPAWWALLGLLLASCSLHFAIGWKARMVVYALQAAIFPLVLVGTVLFPTRWTGRVLEAQSVRWFGRLSYSIYLWQQMFLVPPTDAAHFARWIQQFPTNLIAILGLATLSYYLVEQPAVRLGHRIGRVGKGESAVTSAR